MGSIEYLISYDEIAFTGYLTKVKFILSCISNGWLF